MIPQVKKKQAQENFHERHMPKFFPKGMGDIKDSISSSNSQTENILFKLADSFREIEAVNLKAQFRRAREIASENIRMDESDQVLQKSFSKVEKYEKNAPFWDASKNIFSFFSTSVNAVMAIELINMGFVPIGGIFLTSAVLSAARISGFSENKSKWLDGLTIASNVAAIGAGSYTNTLTSNLPNMLTSTIAFAQGATSAGMSFNKQKQELVKSEHYETTQIKERIEYLLKNLLKDTERSFKEEEKNQEIMKYFHQTNLRID